MKAIILKKKNFPQDSLLLETLLEDGRRKKIRLPGILKSKKRYAFYLIVGSIWNFTANHFQNETIIPKESEFLDSPVAESPTYQQLLLLSELLYPLNHLTKAEDHKAIFLYYQELISHWQSLEENKQYSLIVYFYLFLLEQNGLLNHQDNCAICSTPLNQHDFYFFSHGGVCQQCATGLPQQPTIAFGHFTSSQFYQNQNNSLKFLQSEVFVLRQFVQDL